MAMAACAALFAAAAGVFACRWIQGCVQERRKGDRALRGALPARDTDGVEAGGGFARGGFVRARAASRKRKELRRMAIERHVPEMVDAIALGMRAGLSFEGAFALYCDRFDDELACVCRRACRMWESGLVSRDDALRELAREADVASLSRFVGNAVRCLRFGSPMTRMLEMTAHEARSCYRAKMEELVAKAPVKMLMPTAGLILPAMLIVVMGPVLLEFV